MNSLEVKNMRCRYCPLAVLLLGVGSMILLLITGSRAKPVETQEQSWTVETERVEWGPHSPNLRLYGNVESQWQVELTAAINANVAEVWVAEGDTVKKGELLIRLDDQDQRLFLEEKEAEIANLNAQLMEEKQQHESNKEALVYEQKLVKFARASVSRSENLLDRNLSAQANVDDASEVLSQRMLAVSQRNNLLKKHASTKAKLQAQLDKLGAEKERSERDLLRAEIRAPFNARIAKLHAAPGDWSRSGDLLAEAYDLNKIEVRVQVPTASLSPMRQALNDQQPVTGSVRLGNETWEVKLDRLSAVMERGAVDAFFQFSGEIPNIEIGHSMVITVNLPEIPRAVAVPEEALYNDRVYIVVEGRLKTVNVERLGMVLTEAGEKRWLVSPEGLPNQSELVISHLPNAIDGLKVSFSEH